MKAQLTTEGIKINNNNTLEIPLDVQRVIIRGAVMGEVWKIQNKMQDTLLQKKDSIINNRDETIFNKDTIILSKNERIENDSVIKLNLNKDLANLKKEVRQQKFKKVGGITLGLLLGAAVGILVEDKYEITRKP